MVADSPGKLVAARVELDEALDVQRGGERVNTHDLDSLRRSFAVIPSPSTKWIGLIEAAANTAPEVVGPAKLGAVKRFFIGYIEKRRLEAAAWRWLKPDPRLDLDRLSAIQAALALSHMSTSEFAARVAEGCRLLAEQHPALSRYIDGRIADLEFVSRTSRESEQIESKFELYQRQLLMAALNPLDSSAISGVDTLVPESIATAAAEIKLTLDESSDYCNVHANLMVSAAIQCRVEDIPGALGELGQTDGAREAAWLWRGLTGQVHRVFVVVSETAGSRYRGFWIPDVRKNGVAFPGAPRAFQTGAAHAVVVDDLPPVPLEDEELAARWRTYLRGDKPAHFQGSMFASFPVFRVEPGNDTVPVAVLNVNVVGKIWRRAYSRHWLGLATRRVGAWSAVAWHATTLAFVLRRSNVVDVARLEVPDLGRRLQAGGDHDEDER